MSNRWIAGLCAVASALPIAAAQARQTPYRYSGLASLVYRF